MVGGLRCRWLAVLISPASPGQHSARVWCVSSQRCQGMVSACDLTSTKVFLQVGCAKYLLGSPDSWLPLVVGGILFTHEVLLCTLKRRLVQQHRHRLHPCRAMHLIVSLGLNHAGSADCGQLTAAYSVQWPDVLLRMQHSAYPWMVADLALLPAQLCKASFSLFLLLWYPIALDSSSNVCGDCVAVRHVGIGEAAWGAYV